MLTRVESVAVLELEGFFALKRVWCMTAMKPSFEAPRRAQRGRVLGQAVEHAQESGVVHAGKDSRVQKWTCAALVSLTESDSCLWTAAGMSSDMCSSWEERTLSSKKNPRRKSLCLWPAEPSPATDLSGWLFKTILEGALCVPGLVPREAVFFYTYVSASMDPDRDGDPYSYCVWRGSETSADHSGTFINMEHKQTTVRM